MSNLIWKGPTNALVYQPNSPRLVYGDRVKAVDIYKGVQSLCAAGMLARGTFGTGGRAGWVVNQCTVDTSRGDVGTLTIEWEAGGSEADQPLPMGDFNLEPQEIYPKIERNQFFSGIVPDVVRGVYNALYAFNQSGNPNAYTTINAAINGVNFSVYPNTNAAVQFALGTELLNKLANGEESFYIAGYRYSFESFSYTQPALSNGGIVYNAAAGHTPGGPLSVLPGGISWLRLADKLDPAGVNGSMYKLTVNFIGGPDGYWDTDLYTEY
jgi:hypothetical protein